MLTEFSPEKRVKKDSNFSNRSEFDRRNICVNTAQITELFIDPKVNIYTGWG